MTQFGGSSSDTDNKGAAERCRLETELSCENIFAIKSREESLEMSSRARHLVITNSTEFDSLPHSGKREEMLNIKNVNNLNLVSPLMNITVGLSTSML